MPAELFIFIILGILFLGLAGWIIFLELRLKKFFKGSSGENLEKSLKGLIENLEKLEKRAKVSENHLEDIEQRLKNCVQKTGVVRFNPFSDTGGDQSFSVALLNERKNGVVISSLYGREINRVYGKPIENGESRYQLSKEEKEAIEKAN